MGSDAAPTKLILGIESTTQGLGNRREPVKDKRSDFTSSLYLSPSKLLPATPSGSEPLASAWEQRRLVKAVTELSLASVKHPPRVADTQVTETNSTMVWGTIE